MFAYAMTVQLSWHVQNLIMITWWDFKWEQSKIITELKLELKNLLVHALLCFVVINSLGPSDTMWRQEIWVTIGSGNGLLPDGIKPLPEPMLTYHQ